MNQLFNQITSDYRFLPIVGAVVTGGAILYLLTRHKTKRGVLKTDYKKDFVYLYEFPSCETIVTVSPFALKVESFMRLFKIPYESTKSIKNWSSKGQVPFIELNGEEIADSNMILDKLHDHFKINENQLSEYEQGVSRTIAMTLDQQTVFSYFYYRYVIATDAFIATWKFVNGFKRRLIAKSFPYTYRKKAYYQGLGRLSISEICQIGIKDLKALSQILGSKDFIHGDEPTLVDCYTFAHLSQLLYIPSVDYPHTKYIHDHCQNLVAYTERFKQRFWPDWDEICRKTNEK